MRELAHAGGGGRSPDQASEEVLARGVEEVGPVASPRAVAEVQEQSEAEQKQMVFLPRWRFPPDVIPAAWRLCFSLVLQVDGLIFKGRGGRVERFEEIGAARECGGDGGGS